MIMGMKGVMMTWARVSLKVDIHLFCILLTDDRDEKLKLINKNESFTHFSLTKRL